MLSIQDICDKYSANLKRVRNAMDRSAEFHPDDASVYTGLNWVEQQSVRETLRAIPYSKLKEYLSKGTTIGNYLAADKVYDDLVFKAGQTDIVPLISAEVVYGWRGADLIVNVADDASYAPNYVVSGAVAPSETVNTTKCTLTPKSFNISLGIGMDLEEDTGYALTSYHVQKAAEAIGRFSTSLALEVLRAPPDGVGTANTLAGSADETTYAQLLNGMSLVGDDFFTPNTAVITLEAWRHSIGATAAGIPGTMAPAPPEGFHIQLQLLSVRFCSDPLLHLSTDVAGAVMTKCKTIVLDNKAALLTGRKRWMQIDNYADPVKDLLAAVVSCRQDSVTLYKDAGCVITET